MNSIHSRIKQRREALGMSMQDLADKVGASAWQTVQQWEKEGGTAPKRARLEAVAKALHTTPEALLFGEEQAAVLGSIDQIVGKLKEASEPPSEDAMKVARAFDSLNEAQRQAVLSQLVAFGAITLTPAKRTGSLVKEKSVSDAGAD